MIHVEPEIQKRARRVLEHFADYVSGAGFDARRLSGEDVPALLAENEHLRATIARVRHEIDAQPYRHMDAPCTDRCVEAVCDDVRKALDEPATEEWGYAPDGTAIPIQATESKIP